MFHDPDTASLISTRNRSSSFSNESRNFESTSAPQILGQCNQGILRMPLDVMKYTISFCSAVDIALFSVTSHGFHRVAKLLQLDAVRHIAFFNEAKDRYEIRGINSVEKGATDVRLEDMTLTTISATSSGTKATRQFLLSVPREDIDAKWAQFYKCNLRGISKANCNGFWKLLSEDKEEEEDDDDDDDKECDWSQSVRVPDLNTIRSLLLHPVVALRVLDYTSTSDNPFQHPVNVYIAGGEHGHHSHREYRLSFWNGGDIGQSTALQLTRNQTGVSDLEPNACTQFFIQCQTSPPQIRWQWYDNNAAMFRNYACGPAVDAQLEVSFQANLHFPASIGRFSNVNFNTFKEAIIRRLNAKEAAHKRRRHFLLRFRFLKDVRDEFDEKDGHQVLHRKIGSVEQIAIHPRPYCTFPRIVRRIRKSLDSAREDQVDYERRNRRLRMESPR